MGVGARGKRPGDQFAPAPEIQKNYQFPRMPFSELQEDMAEYERPITKEIMRAPSATDVAHFIEFFLELIYNKRREDMAQPSFGCLDVLAFPELQEASVPLLHFTRQCQEMFTAAHFDAFTIRDLHAPERSRFHWQISAMINFAKFRQTRFMVFQEMSGNQEDLIESQSNLIAQTADVRGEITAIEESRAEKEQEVEVMKERMAGMKLEFTDLYKQQIAVSDENRDLKGLLTKKTEQCASHKLAQMTLSEEVDRHRSRVCSSPDRVKGEIEDMRENLAAEKENVISMDRRTQALKSRVVGVRAACLRVTNLSKAVEEAVAGEERMRTLEAEIEAGKRRAAEYAAELERMTSTKTHQERNMKSFEQRLARIRQTSAETYNNSSDEYRHRAEKRQALEEEQMQVDRAIEEKGRQAAAIQQAIQSSATAFAEELEQLTKAQALANEKFSSYHTDIMKGMEFVTADSTKSLQEYKQEIKAYANVAGF